jgi:UDP-N-acetylglucosamine/UDP-N-acetylgalactosamine diphosphorylase
MREPIETNNGSPPPLPPQALLERLKDYGQEDAFALWDELSTEERELLVKDVEVNSHPPTSVLLLDPSLSFSP